MVCGDSFGGCLLLAVLTTPECSNLGEFLRGFTPLNALFFHFFSGMGKEMVPWTANNDPKCTNPHRAVDLNKFAYNEIVRFYCPMRVPSFLIIDRFVSCTHFFPMLEKNGEKRALKEGYAPSLRILPQVGTGSTEGHRKDNSRRSNRRTPVLANPWMSLWRFKSPKKDFGDMLRLKVSPRGWKVLKYN